MKKSRIAIICLALLSLIATCVSITFLADTIPTHFGIDGTIDAYGSKYTLFLFPGVSISICSIMLLVERYAKLSDNYKKYLLIVGVIVAGLFLAVNVLFIMFALAYAEKIASFDPTKIMMIIVGAVLIVLSNIMPKIEKNRTLGIKTKWSKYNEITWQKTHRFGGFVGLITGFIILLSGVFFGKSTNFIIIVSLIVVYVTSVTIASYIFYKKEKSKKIINKN